MASVADCSAAPSEVTIAGKKLLLYPLTDEDYGHLQRWLEDRVMAIAKRNMSGLSESAQRDLLQIAHERACNVTLYDPDSLKSLTTLEGATKVLWLSLHKAVTEDELRDMLLKDPTALSNAMSRSAMDGDPLRPFGSTKARKRRKSREARKWTRGTVAPSTGTSLKNTGGRQTS